MKKTIGQTSPFKLISPVESIASPTPEFRSLVNNIQSSIDSRPGKDDDQNLVKYINEYADLKEQIREAGNKLVLITFLLLGVQRSDNMLMKLITKTKKYQNSFVILVVDVAKLGEIAKQYEAAQIPWFTFIKNNNVLQAYHSVQIDRVEITIQKNLSFYSSSSGSEHVNTVRTYIKDGDDLNRRLSEAEKKLVVLAFLISDDEAGQRLNMELDGIEEREKDVEILKVDVDLCQELAEKYHIQGVPTIVILKNRLIVDQFMGTDAVIIHKAITKYKTPKDKINEVERHDVSKEPSSSIGMIVKPPSLPQHQSTTKSFDLDHEGASRHTMKDDQDDE